MGHSHTHAPTHTHTHTHTLTDGALVAGEFVAADAGEVVVQVQARDVRTAVRVSTQVVRCACAILLVTLHKMLM